MASQGLTEGTARDYAWAFKCLLRQRGMLGKGTAKMQSVTNIARPKIDVFMRLPQFVHAGQVKVVASGQSAIVATSDSTAGRAKMVYARDRASKVQGSCAIVPADMDKVKRSMKLRPLGSSMKHLGGNSAGGRSLPKRHFNGGREASKAIRAEPGLDLCPEDYIDFGEFDDLDEELLLKIAEQDPRVQALLDAGDECDSSVGDDNSDTEGLLPEDDLDLWDHVCAAIWPDDV